MFIYLSYVIIIAVFFFFKQKTAYEMRISDWSSDVCSSDLYVPNLTIGPMVCEAIRPHTDAPIDVHLMVEPVDAIIPQFAKAGANIITFHPEASKHPDRSLSLIRDLGCKAGLVFNPATSLNWMDHVMDKLEVEIGRASFRERGCQYV